MNLIIRGSHAGYDQKNEQMLQSKKLKLTKIKSNQYKAKSKKPTAEKINCRKLKYKSRTKEI